MDTIYTGGAVLLLVAALVAVWVGAAIEASPSYDELEG